LTAEYNLQRRVSMFYEVRIMDRNDQIKKIVSTKELSRRHWVSFEKSQQLNVLPQIKKKKTQSNRSLI